MDFNWNDLKFVLNIPIFLKLIIQLIRLVIYWMFYLEPFMGQTSFAVKDLLVFRNPRTLNGGFIFLVVSVHIYIFIFVPMIDLTKYKLTSKGLEIPGATEALKKNLEQFPTYDDLLKRHTEHFKVKEIIRLLGL